MNVYLIVEGTGEKPVYEHWVPLVNPNLSVVDSLDEVKNNNLIIYSGGGYPNYFDVIQAGVEDVAESEQLDRLVISIDSEAMSYQEKREEIEEFVSALGRDLEYRVVVQHFCLETWALGNKVIVKRNPRDRKLREYMKFFDVVSQDPELLPDYSKEDLTRAQFAARYLKKLLNERYRGTYKKGNPRPLLHDLYYERVRRRFEETGHIASFEDFLSAFV